MFNAEATYTDWWKNDPFYNGHALVVAAFASQAISVMEASADHIFDLWEAENADAPIPTDAEFIAWIAENIPAPQLVSDTSEDAQLARKFRKVQLASWQFWLGVPKADRADQTADVSQYPLPPLMTPIADGDVPAETYIEALNRMASELWWNTLVEFYREYNEPDDGDDDDGDDE